MRTFLTALLVLPLLAGLGGCSSLATAVNAVRDASVSPRVALTAANTFDGLELTAKNILVLCTPASRPVACDDASLRTMNAAVLAGRPLRASIEATLTTDPGAQTSASVYSKLEAIIMTLQSTITAFNAASTEKTSG